MNVTPQKGEQESDKRSNVQVEGEIAIEEEAKEQTTEESALDLQDMEDVEFNQWQKVRHIK